jgi:peptidoglycan/xylan/chitin deacetylase (PgdA/CDA1 family)
MAPVRILLTFDDGPHDGALGGGNRTEQVLDALKHKRIKAAFFVQTHAPNRLASPNGSRIGARIHAEGHLLAIHTGSFAEHRCHRWRCGQPPDILGSSNGLDSDMIRAKAAIRGFTGTDPQFVRATYGYTDDHCMEVYAHNRLQHIYWDLVSGDDAKTASHASVQAHLTAATKRAAIGAVDLIYLLHDINRVTAEHISDFIEVISTSVQENGHMPIFVTDRIEAAFVMSRKSRRGTDTPCPPGSMD